MMKHILILPDGREISSGQPGAAVMECAVTAQAAAGHALAPGSVCAAMAEITLMDDGTLSIQKGDELRLFREADGKTEQIGIFRAEAPQKTGQLWKLTAYDRLRLLDKDLSQWLQGLDGWPYSLETLADMVCAQCGVTLSPGDIPNGSFPVEKCAGDRITGRMLLGWVAEAAGCFCVADAQGCVAFGWYAPGQTPAYCNCVELEGGDTPPIEKVVLRQNATDIGTAFPENQDGFSLCITGNPLLAAKNADTLKGVAQTLYAKFHGLSCAPGTVTAPAGSFRLGQVVECNGRKFYVNQLTTSAQGDRAVCLGAGGEVTHAIETQSAKSLAGKFLSLQADVDGLRLENADAAENAAKLSLEVGGIKGQVSASQGQLDSLRTAVTTLEQTAQGLSLAVETTRTQGASKLKTAMGYTFDDGGLRIARPGQQMENLLDNTGMYVRRGGEVILQANDRGVQAVDVTVGSYLQVGDHARLENYGAGRTACFYLEG